MADSLRSTNPVSPAGGFAGRAPAHPERPAGPPAEVARREPDRIDVAAQDAVARRILRERVLARTREGLELGGTDHGHEYAEAIDTEPVSAFLGRLLSAQNQLGARRLPAWGGPRVRRALDAALRQGAEETLELLAGDAQAVAVVAEVLAEYGRRLAALAREPGPGV